MSKTILIKQRFRSSIRRGTGEAYLLAQQYPAIDFSNDIIKASVKNYSYDGQCEGSRAEYLWAIIKLSRHQNKIHDAILKALATENKHTWSLTQLFDLARQYAQQGDTESKQAIYDRFFTNIIDGSDWAGASEILELDGMEGLKYIAAKMGGGLENNPDDAQGHWMVSQFQQDNPEIKVMKVLEEAAIDNRLIRLYVDEIKRSQENQNNHRHLKVVYNDIVEEILSRKSRRFYRNNLPDEELTLIAKRFLTEKNKQNREKLLAVFSRHKYPLDSDHILQLAKQYAKPGNKLGKIALDALAYLKGDNIREFALEQIKSSKKPELFTCILQANYQKGDGKLLTELVKKAKSEFVVECLIYDYINIFQTNKTRECREPLEALYEKSNCGMHRSDVVRLLIKNNVLSEKIKAELNFDSDEDTRKLAAALTQA